ncbi:YfjI family protein [Paraburkholderia saeva]|uniref:DUF3987 domain-containing protein n=1 Tax=Paraburkholderia saeva TaxID=2777537 RepID=A0A9N8X0Q8_9BURK|nr:YfjI family protein [Paraburkholderia saeva]CAG4889812.1 hypothetical protein LMG31841_00901 [Paraburkholderia saeva]
MGVITEDEAAIVLARSAHVREGRQRSTARLAQAEAAAWPDAQPLIHETAPLDYPVDSLPDSVSAAVREVQAFVQAPFALVVSSAITALSLAIQSLVDVQRDEHLIGPAGLFLLTIADSGERKSTCDGFFTMPVRNYEAQQRDEHAQAVVDHRSDLSAWEAKRAGLLDKIRRARGSNGSGETALLERDLREMDRNKPTPPKVPRLIFESYTPESLAYELGTKWPSGGVVSAEAGIVFGSHGMGTDSIMRNLATLNSLWDGKPLTVDRRTSDSFTVDGARLTVALQVQRATLMSFVEKSGALARGTGFLARFLIAWPQSTQGTRFYKAAPENWPQLGVFNERVSELLREPAPIDEHGRLAPALLALSPEAKASWIAFHDNIESELKDGGELAEVRDVASKAADNAARLAALFHVFSGAAGPISVDAFERASSIVAWHLSESKRFFSESALSENETDAARLDAWLRKYCRAESTLEVEKIYALQHSPLRKAPMLDAALRSLENLDRLRVVRPGKNPAQTRTIIHLNPALGSGGEQ